MLKIIDYIIDFFDTQTIGVEGRSILSFSKSVGCLQMLESIIKELDKEEFLLANYKRSLRPIEDEIDSKKKAVKNEIIANMSIFILSSQTIFNKLIRSISFS